MIRILTLLFSLLPILLFSQATYESDNFAAIGEEYVLSIATDGLVDLDFSATGANVSWDFSSLAPGEQTTQNWIDPGDSGYQLTWCFLNGFIFNCNDEFEAITNLALQEDSETIELGTFSLSDVVNHYRLTNNALEVTMVGASLDAGVPVNVPFDYTIPDTILEFPVNFGNSGESYSEFEVDLADLGVNLSFKSTATRTYTVDGWGALSTPFADYDSVLRVYAVIERNDTLVFEGNTIPVPSTQIEIRWLDPEMGVPVMEARGVSAAGLDVITEVRYPDTLQCLTPDPFFAFNPLIYFDETSGDATVNFSNFTDNADSYSWDFGDGGSSTDQSPEHSYLCPGAYDVVLTATNSCDPDASETFELPLIVLDTTDYFQGTTDLLLCEGDSILIGDTYISEAGTYELMLSSVNGCDSALTANVALQPVNTEVDLNDETLTAMATNAQYQWLDCEDDFAPIAGANEASFTPSVSGSYAVDVTQNGCTARSECNTVMVVGTQDLTASGFVLSVAPNPVANNLRIALRPALLAKTQLRVTDVFGRILYTEECTGMESRTLNVDFLPAGTYYLRINTAAGHLVRPFQKL